MPLCNSLSTRGIALSHNMNIGNAYRRARNALCFEKADFAVTVQLGNIKAKKNRQKKKKKKN